MLTPHDLHGYQHHAVSHILEHNESMLWIDMGLGKTVVSLTAICHLYDIMKIWGVLVVAPKRVIESVWRQEARIWEHTKHLTFALISGTRKERELALFGTRADIYLVSYDNLAWLTEELKFRWLKRGKYLPFNMVILDEVTRVKNARMRQGVACGRAILQLRPYIDRCVGLTGTPASNGLLDLFGQYLVLDWGKRLGESYEAYKMAHFRQLDWNGYRWGLLPGAGEQIKEKIGDITLTMKNEDYLKLPPFVFNEIELELPEATQKKYKAMEKEFFLAFDSGHELEIANEASLTNRCLQFANGAVYKAPGAPEWEAFHTVKLDALEEVIEEAAGQPILVLYSYRHDAERIIKKFPQAKRISADLSGTDFNVIVDEWNAGLLPMLVGHPASIGHGLNIQAGGNIIVWFGLPWALDLYDQANARLRRQGQDRPVVVHRLVMRHTLDEAVRIALQLKAEEELGIREAIARYRQATVVQDSVG